MIPYLRFRCAWARADAGVLRCAISRGDTLEATSFGHGIGAALHSSRMPFYHHLQPGPTAIQHHQQQSPGTAFALRPTAYHSADALR